MEIIPSVSFKNGYLVVVQDGKYRYYKEEGEKVPPSSLLNILTGYEKLYLLDLDGIEHNSPQMEVIRVLSSRRELWADPGVNDIETVTDVYVAGSHRVVLSTKSMDNIELLEQAVEISRDMVLCVDTDSGIISRSTEICSKGIRKMIEEAVDMGIEKIVLTNLSGTKFSTSHIREVPEGDFELYIGGGIENQGDDLTDRVDGVLLGFEEALKYQKKN